MGGLNIRNMALMRMPNTAAVAMAGKPLGKMPGTVIGMKTSSVYEILPVTSLPLILKPPVQTMDHKKNTPSAEKASKTVVSVPQNLVTVYLKNGSEISGELVSEDAESINLNIDGGQVGFQHSEINRIVRKKN